MKNEWGKCQQPVAGMNRGGKNIEPCLEERPCKFHDAQTTSTTDEKLKEEDIRQAIALIRLCERNRKAIDFAIGMHAYLEDTIKNIMVKNNIIV